MLAKVNFPFLALSGQCSMTVVHPADVEEGFSQVFCLIFHYGYDESGGNVMLYMIFLVIRLAQTVAQEMQANQWTRKKNSFNAPYFWGNCEILFRRCWRSNHQHLRLV
jgi:hypothetical protein